MTLVYKQGASIEGRSLKLTSRAPIAPAPPIRETSGLQYRFRLTQNSEAEIVEECEPKSAKIKSTSLLSRGDALRAAKISGYSSSPLGRSILVRASENHRASQCKCQSFGFAQIDIPLRTVLALIAAK